MLMLKESPYSKVNVTEWMLFRFTFSVYAGWVTAATVVNAGYLIMALDLVQTEKEERIFFYSTLAFVFFAYVISTFWQRNPVYGLILIWTLQAVKDRQFKYQLELEQVIVVYCFFNIVAWIFCIYEKVKGDCTHGLFY